MIVRSSGGATVGALGGEIGGGSTGGGTGGTGEAGGAGGREAGIADCEGVAATRAPQPMQKAPPGVNRRPHRTQNTCPCSMRPLQPLH